jgi:NAD(P)-dependent dehydrogenase (short-subunit alcohol dehydrogenase family)
MSGRLKDKVCIITGTGSGMGRAAALLFCKEGANVVGCDVNIESAEATLRDAQRADGQMVSLQPADLTKQNDCDALVDLALKTYGGIDVVYNNAATAYFGWMDKFTYDEFARTIEEELLIVFVSARRFGRIWSRAVVVQSSTSPRPRQRWPTRRCRGSPILPQKEESSP